MKKIVLFIFSVVIGLSFTSCEDPYANQKVASPTAYPQETLQDTTGFAAALKTGVSPLTIATNKLTSPLALLTCSSVLNRVDTTTKAEYKIQFTNVATFANFINIPITFDGKAGSDVSVDCKQFNDSIKTYNKNAVQRTVYVRLLSYIVKGGLKTVYTSKVATLLVTPNNYVPTPVNDIVSLPMNSFVNIDVLANDTDPEKDVLTVSAVGTATHGTVTINTDGKVKYTPTVGYSGADNFSYTVSDGNGNTTTANVDVTVMAIMPYTATTPRPWYLVGAAIGDGSWNNATAGLGVALYPLSVVTGNKYNIAGDGEFTYTGYFEAGKAFKLIRDPGSWAEQWGVTNGVYTHNTGSDITVPTSGYYTINLNSITNVLTIVPAVITPTVYSSMNLSGDFNGWSATTTPMTKGASTNSHIWYANITVAAAGGIKFNYNNWAISWGATQFPVGIAGSVNSPNIPIIAGTYTVLFNDIDGTYYFK